MQSPPGSLTRAVQEQVALDRKEPGLEVPITSAKMPAADGPFETILDEIIGSLVVAEQGPGVPPERRDVGLNETGNLIHRAITLFRGSLEKPRTSAGNSFVTPYRHRRASKIPKFASPLSIAPRPPEPDFSKARGITAQIRLSLWVGVVRAPGSPFQGGSEIRRKS
jgi:hypothetical protein